ncbi:MAG: MaoC family dehydratase N-terminal domain-containing protein [Propionibacteriaceae bacterium]|nr:MaoC family dehydratase N-terminal domain-containing protein [Propionibacteriaceae bacterium]
MTDPLLCATTYVDYLDPAIQNLALSFALVFEPDSDKVKIAETAFFFVRDEIPHTTTTDRQIVTVKASDVLAERTGICHAKANLLAALLRARGIPAGFAFQRVTVGDDASDGYCLHALVVAKLDGRLVPLDPRPGMEFGEVGPVSEDLGETNLPGLWSNPDQGTMDVLQASSCLDDAMRALPDKPSAPPDDLSFAVSAAPIPWLPDIVPGAHFVSSEIEMTAEAIIEFAKQYDPQLAHTDPEAAKNTAFHGLSSSGWLTACVTAKLVTEPGMAFHGNLLGSDISLKWPTPTRPGDRLHVELDIATARLSRSRPGWAVITAEYQTVNQDGEVRQRTQATVYSVEEYV